MLSGFSHMITPTKGHEPVSYRPEIDGLRAVAVLAVVLYHFAVPALGGGFVGVDIFFVISGFLIGGILWRELSANGSISFLDFYVRRIKRLTPAFAAMAVATFVAAYFVLLPSEFREFGKTMIASAFYFANIYFYRKSGYFDTGSEEKPLLHTWSLSVEEQFYIALPILFFLLRNRRTMLLWCLAILVSTSLVLCVYKTYTEHTAAFFLFPFRAWELGAGVLLAIFVSSRPAGDPDWPVLSWIGLALLIGAIVFVQPGPAFPGFQAIAPVAGALLVIYAGRQANMVNSLLSSGPAVFVGKISYSLYLWHWPVLTLGQYHSGGSLSPAVSATLLVLSFVLAVLSWRFVEVPTRHAAWFSRSWLLAGGASAAAVACLGAGAYLTEGVPGRFPPAIRAHIDASQDFLQDWSRCSTATSAALPGIEVCPVGPADKPPEFLVWGDSHVRAIKEGVAQIADEKGVAGWIIWRAGCPPLFDIRKEENSATEAQNEACAQANAQIRKGLAELPSTIKSVVLVGRWSYYDTGRGVGIDDVNTISLHAAAGKADSTQAAVFDHAVTRTVGELAQRFDRVFVLQQPPEIQQYASKMIARRLSAGRIEDDELRHTLSIPVKDAHDRASPSETPFLALAAQSRIVWLATWSKFCDTVNCGVLHDGRSNYFDNNHITNFAASRIRDVLGPVFSPAASR